MALDLITAVNLVLCAAIVALGYKNYMKDKKNKVPFYIGAAFGLFGISHLATLLGYKTALESILVVIRTAAYLAVVYALYEKPKKKK